MEWGGGGIHSFCLMWPWKHSYIYIYVYAQREHVYTLLTPTYDLSLVYTVHIHYTIHTDTGIYSIMQRTKFLKIISYSHSSIHENEWGK